jgi:hypothetical protein
MRDVDHLYCAMSSVSSLRERCGTPMQASMLEFVLATDDMTTEVIADGRHLSSELPSWRWLGAPRSFAVPAVTLAFAPDRLVQALSRLRNRRERPGRTRLDEDAPTFDQVRGNRAPCVDTAARPVHVHHPYGDVLNLVGEAPQCERQSAFGVLAQGVRGVGLPRAYQKLN